MPTHMENLQRFVDACLDGKPELRLLEAGCGSGSWLDFHGRAHVVGIDISAKQLARNKLIHEAVHGDLVVHRFAAERFDVIVCIDVLEHLDRPEAALANLCDALVAQGGLMVLKLPNVMSLKGLVTKFTPHGLHVWVFRHVFGRPNAGIDEVGPFKTYLRWSIRPQALRRWGAKHGLTVPYEDWYESGFQLRLRAKLGPFDVLVKLLDLLVRALSAGNLSVERTEYIIVLQKVGTPPLPQVS